MWNAFKIFNETPYTFQYSSYGRQGVQTLHGKSSGSYYFAIPPIKGLQIQYGNHKEPALIGHGGGTAYTIRLSRDNKKFELVHCMLGTVMDTCPNYARVTQPTAQANVTTTGDEQVLLAKAPWRGRPPRRAPQGNDSPEQPHGQTEVAPPLATAPHQHSSTAEAVKPSYSRYRRRKPKQHVD
ncbi:uncharacterized protein KZ484_008030 [Pholidichthys leucotaenia]